jgi:hypothetical protein
VWHASVGRGHERDQCLVAWVTLAGVGDASLGEWSERGDLAFHLRRRLSPTEAATIGPVVDVRATAEGARRFAAMRPWLPIGWREMV